MKEIARPFYRNHVGFMAKLLGMLRSFATTKYNMKVLFSSRANFANNKTFYLNKHK